MAAHANAAAGPLFVGDGARRLTLAPANGSRPSSCRRPGDWRADYAKARVRDAVDFPLAGVAVALRREGAIDSPACAAITGTNSAPLVVPTEGAPAGPGMPGRMTTARQRRCRPPPTCSSTTVAPVKYRRRMLQALVRRLTDELWTRA